MSIDLVKHKELINKVYNDLLDDKTGTNWVLFGYEGQSNTLKVVGHGDGGVEELAEDLNASKIMYAVVRVIDPNTSRTKNVLINWQGEAAPNLRKGICSRHLSDVKRALKGIHITVTARTEEEAEENIIVEAVAKASATEYNFNQRSDSPERTGPVGTNYKRTNPLSEINTNVRNQFWEEQEAEEKNRKEIEMKKREEEAINLEKERMEREIKDLKHREELTKERNLRIQAEQKAEERGMQGVGRTMEEGWEREKEMEQQQMEEAERARRADQMRMERKKEAESLIGHKTHETRSLFEGRDHITSVGATADGKEGQIESQKRSVSDSTPRKRSVGARWPPPTTAQESIQISHTNKVPGKISEWKPTSIITEEPKPAFNAANSSLSANTKQLHESSTTVTTNTPKSGSSLTTNTPKSGSSSHEKSTPTVSSLCSSHINTASNYSAWLQRHAAALATDSSTQQKDITDSPSTDKKQTTNQQQVAETHHPTHEPSNISSVRNVGTLLQHSVTPANPQASSSPDFLQQQSETSKLIKQTVSKKDEQSVLESNKSSLGQGHCGSTTSIFTVADAEEESKHLYHRSDSLQETVRAHDVIHSSVRAQNSVDSVMFASSANYHDTSFKVYPEKQSPVKAQLEASPISYTQVKNQYETQDGSGAGGSVAPNSSQNAIHNGSHGNDEDDNNLNETVGEGLQNGGQYDDYDDNGIEHVSMTYEVDGVEYQILPEHGLCARALYDYQAADETEITFDPSDIITNIDQIDVGWWQGVNPAGEFGLFPANYVELINGSRIHH